MADADLPGVRSTDAWFSEVTAEAGISTALHPGYGHSWGDIDGDGWLDVWIVNHMYRPTIHRNNRNGSFIDITNTAWSGSTVDFHGGAWADFDNDGDPDFAVLAGGDGGTKCCDKPFYVNHGGVMTNEARIRNLNDRCGRGRTPLWLDWNNDGLLDLYMVNGRRLQDLESPSRLMLQQADGTFTELVALQTQSEAFMAQTISLRGTNHLLSLNSPHPVAFHRVGDVTQIPFRIRDSTSDELPSHIRDAAIADFDGDLQDELFIVRTKPPGRSFRVTDSGERVDVLVKNISDGPGVTMLAPNAGMLTFRFWMVPWQTGDVRIGQGAKMVSVRRVVGDYLGEKLVWSEFTVSAAHPDLLGVPPDDQRETRGVYIGRQSDGRIGVYAKGASGEALEFDLNVDFGPISSVQGIGFDFRMSIDLKPSFLFYESGEFVNRAKEWGLNKSLSCGSVIAADFDNDMDVDLFMACTGSTTHQSNRLFENKGDYFLEVVDAGGGAVAWSAEPGGVASVADYDNDGYLDVLVAEGCEVCGPLLRFGNRTLLKNIRSGNHWIQLDLIGCQSNRDAIGARLIATAGGKQQMRIAGGGMHRAAQDQKRIHFGLALNTHVDRLRIEWPSGIITVTDGLAADHIYEIREDVNCLRP
ncbi:MAG: CRTAC1 family protein [Burkholderiales bacterium]|nr:CRTAC1 family protein [Burkholderiales bacterium]